MEVLVDVAQPGARGEGALRIAAVPPLTCNRGVREGHETQVLVQWLDRRPLWSDLRGSRADMVERGIRHPVLLRDGPDDDGEALDETLLADVARGEVGFLSEPGQLARVQRVLTRHSDDLREAKGRRDIEHVARLNRRERPRL